MELITLISNSVISHSDLSIIDEIYTCMILPFKGDDQQLIGFKKFRLLIEFECDILCFVACSTAHLTITLYKNIFILILKFSIFLESLLYLYFNDMLYKLR